MNRLVLLREQLHYATRHPLVRRIAWVDAALLALVLATTGFWWPAHSAHRAVLAQTEETRRLMVEAMHSAELARAYQRAAQAVERIERKLDVPVKQAALVEALGKLARKHGVRIVSESFDEGKMQGSYQATVLDLSVQGKYGEVRAFLGEVSTLPTLVVIQEARLERLRESAGSIRAQLQLVAYRALTAKSARS